MPISTPLTKQKEYYSDFSADFKKNPVTNDVSVIRNENAVKQSIRNLILTDRGERPFQPRIGSKVKQMLFENVNPFTMRMIETLAKETIMNYEPRANVIAVEATGSSITGSITLTILFTVINRSEPVTLDIILKRER